MAAMSQRADLILMGAGDHLCLFLCGGSQSRCIYVNQARPAPCIHRLRGQEWCQACKAAAGGNFLLAPSDFAS